MAIQDIEKLTYEEAKAIAEEELNIKEHDCLLVRFENSFGYSILIFKNGRQIYHANDYELHHRYIVKEKGYDELRRYYITHANAVLFTDKEMMEEVSSYEEYSKKQHFLRNYWIMRYPYKTAFFIGSDAEKNAYYKKIEKEFPYMCFVSYCYVKSQEIINTQYAMYKHLKEELKKLLDNNTTFKEAVRCEMINHEVGYSGEKYESLEALGLTYKDLAEEKKNIVDNIYKELTERL